MILSNPIHVCFRSGQARNSLCDGEEGGHQDHQQGEAQRIRSTEGQQFFIS